MIMLNKKNSLSLSNSLSFIVIEKHNPKLQYNKAYKDTYKRNTNQAMHAYSGKV